MKSRRTRATEDRQRRRAIVKGLACLAIVISVAAINAQHAAPVSTLTTDTKSAPGRKLVRTFADLFQSAQTGGRETERAGFVTRDPNGEIGFIPWPATVERRRATFKGSAPPNTMALAHTHPDGMTEPSRQDAGESIRIRLPIYVVARTAISRVEVDGATNRIIENGRWTAKAMQEHGRYVSARDAGRGPTDSPTRSSSACTSPAHPSPDPCRSRTP